MAALIPDDATLAVMSAIAMLRHRGEPVTVDAIEAELRAGALHPAPETIPALED